MDKDATDIFLDEYKRWPKKKVAKCFNEFSPKERKKIILNMNENEKSKFINDIRKQAVKDFWTHERELLKNGECTRDWTPEQIESILNLKKNGSIKVNGGKAFDENGESYYGHHMMNVENNKIYAGDWRNIQALDHDEHYHGAHDNDTTNPTFAYYDPETGRNIPIDTTQFDTPETVEGGKGYIPTKKSIFESDTTIIDKYSKQADVKSFKDAEILALKNYEYANSSKGSIEDFDRAMNIADKYKCKNFEDKFKIYNSESLAVQAHRTQGEGHMGYEGHDKFQNGQLRHDNARLYMVGWEENSARKGQSGKFTDQATINSCMHNGVLDTNELDSKLQLQLSVNGESAQAHSHVSAYDVDYNRLNQLKTENPDLYNKLTAPDGMQSNDIKVAFGEAKANTQNGQGGGHIYFLNPDTVKEAVNSGVLVYNRDASYSIEGGEGINKANRTDIDKAEYLKDRELNAPEHEKKHKLINEEYAKERKEKNINIKEQIDSSVINTESKGFVATGNNEYANEVRKHNEMKKNKIVAAQEKIARSQAKKAGRKM